MRDYIKQLAEQTHRHFRRSLHLGGLCAAILLTGLLAGCISLDRQFAKQADLYMRTTGDLAKDAYLVTLPEDDTKADVEFQHHQFKETIRKALEE